MIKFQRALKVYQQDVEEFLIDLFNQQSQIPERLLDAMRYGTLLGGKRLRPFLVLALSKELGVDPQLAIKVAAAVELVHCYSLMHDDLPTMDNAPLRRGKAAVFCQFDEATAILAGNSLLTLAFQVLTDMECDEQKKIKLIKELCLASGATGMLGGQHLDLEMEKTFYHLTIDKIIHMQQLKTGYLIAYSCCAPVVLADIESEMSQHLQRFSLALGIVYQIIDDLLDVNGEIDLVGKPVGIDLQAGKANFVSLLGPQQAMLKAEQLVKEAGECLQQAGCISAELSGLLKFVVQRAY